MLGSPEREQVAHSDKRGGSKRSDVSGTETANGTRYETPEQGGESGEDLLPGARPDREKRACEAEPGPPSAAGPATPDLEWGGESGEDLPPSARPDREKRACEAESGLKAHTPTSCERAVKASKLSCVSNRHDRERGQETEKAGSAHHQQTGEGYYLSEHALGHGLTPGAREDHDISGQPWLATQGTRETRDDIEPSRASEQDLSEHNSQTAFGDCSGSLSPKTDNGFSSTRPYCPERRCPT